LSRVGSKRQVSDGEGVDRLVVEVHGLLKGVEVEFAEVVFRDHGHADALVALLVLRLLLLLLRDLELRGVEVHELGLDVFLCDLLLRLDRCLLLLLLLRLLRLLLGSRCGLRSLLLELVDIQSRRIGADVVKEGCECLVAKESLNEATVALVFLKNAGVLAAQVVGILGLEGNFAFELANVFCEMLV
jgi:hypothetical protein